jgi:hypothetical protein
MRVDDVTRLVDMPLTPNCSDFTEAAASRRTNLLVLMLYG